MAEQIGFLVALLLGVIAFIAVMERLRDDE